MCTPNLGKYDVLHFQKEIKFHQGFTLWKLTLWKIDGRNALEARVTKDFCISIEAIKNYGSN